MFMAPYMPGDSKKWLPPVICHGYGGDAKRKIHKLGNFNTFFTLAKTLAPLASPEKNADPLLPFMLSPEGFSPDMGTHVRIDALPNDFSVRQHYEEGWNKSDEPSVCPLIANSIAGFQKIWKSLDRPSWLSAPDKHIFDPLVGREDMTQQGQPKPQRSPVIVSCPGLGSTYIPEVTPHITLLNPHGSKQAYGPTGRVEEVFKDGEYKLPHFPVPTLHDFMLVMNTTEAHHLWGKMGFKHLTYSNVKPVPSFWHLPSEAYSTALCLLLAQYSKSPHSSIEALTQGRMAGRFLKTFTDPSAANHTPVEIYGFSAGSYTGMFVYRLLVEKSHFLSCKFSRGILGAIAFHPILFYDFILHNDASPLETTSSYKKSQARGIERPMLLHCTDDRLKHHVLPYPPLIDLLAGMKEHDPTAHKTILHKASHHSTG